MSIRFGDVTYPATKIYDARQAYEELRGIRKDRDRSQHAFEDRGRKALKDIMEAPHDMHEDSPLRTIIMLPLPPKYWERAMRQETKPGVFEHSNSLPLPAILPQIYDVLCQEWKKPLDRATQDMLLTDGICGPGRTGLLFVTSMFLAPWANQMNSGALPLHGNMPFMCKAHANGKSGWFVVLTKVTQTVDSENVDRSLHYWRFDDRPKAQAFATQLALLGFEPDGRYSVPKKSGFIPYGMDIVKGLLPSDV